MQINDANLSSASLGTTSTGKAKAAAAGAAGRTGAAPGAQGETDAVALSNFSQKISELQEGSPAREARIEALAKAVQNGTYSVDSAALAGKIIDDEFGA